MIDVVYRNRGKIENVQFYKNVTFMNELTKMIK